MNSQFYGKYIYTQLWTYKINRFPKNKYEVNYTFTFSIHYRTSHMQSAIKSLGLVPKSWASSEELPLPYTKCHTIVCLLLATKMFLVNLEQTSSCKFSTDCKLHSLHLWNFFSFCKNLLMLIYSKFKEKRQCQNKLSDFPKYQYYHFIFSQFVMVEYNSRKKIWVSLSVLSYLCSVWYRECCQDLQWTQEQSKRSYQSWW